MDAKTSALRILREEHASMDAVISAFRIVTDNIANGKLAPDFKLLWSIIYYIEEYPEQKHHPKEESVLFPRLRGHEAELDALLDELRHQHKNGGPHLQYIKTVIGRFEAEIPGAVTELARLVKNYDHFHKKHMQLEDSVVMPKAAMLLTPEDWTAIAAAFGENSDPLSTGAVGTNAWFHEFYHRIVYLVPEPWGLGSRSPA
jgi:hemerythrin-like domain-containing protein